MVERIEDGARHTFVGTERRVIMVDFVEHANALVFEIAQRLGIIPGGEASK
jgi:hypothetical protein